MRYRTALRDAPSQDDAMAKPSPQMRALAGALQDCGGEAPLAKKLGVSVEMLSGWIHGREALPADMYLKARELAAVRRR